MSPLVLRLAGVQNPLFTEDAIDVIHEFFAVKEGGKLQKDPG